MFNEESLKVEAYWDKVRTMLRNNTMKEEGKETRKKAGREGGREGAS